MAIMSSKVKFCTASIRKVCDPCVFGLELEVNFPRPRLYTMQNVQTLKFVTELKKCGGLKLNTRKIH